MIETKFWLSILLLAFYQIAVAKSSNKTCYSSTDSEMQNPGFCTTRSHCHNGSLVPPAVRTCKEGEQCCVPFSSRRKSRDLHREKFKLKVMEQNELQSKYIEGLLWSWYSTSKLQHIYSKLRNLRTNKQKVERRNNLH